jgi:glycerol-3-phosphate dehydrogenase
LADKRGGPSDISRAHSIAMAEPGWLDVAGGKLTTYRLIAEEAVDRLVGFLNVKGPRCATAHEPLVAAPGAQRFSAVAPPEPSPELIEHYCTREWAVHLSDVMIRRTSWHYYAKDRPQLADRVAGWMAGTLGWDPARLAAEQAQYRQTLS